MLEGRPATHPGVYKLLDHMTQGKKKNSTPKTRLSKQKYLARVTLLLWRGLIQDETSAHERGQPLMPLPK